MTGDTERGQTTLDFLIGILVFIAVVAFVFLFVPGILEPFGGGDGEDPAVADRIANSLSNEKLGQADNARPRTIDRQCTVEFFKGENGGPPPECVIEGDGKTIEERLSLSSLERVNITISNSSGVLFWDSDDARWVTENGEDITPLKGGDNLPEDRSATITSTRVVSLQGEPVTIRVRVW